MPTIIINDRLHTGSCLVPAAFIYQYLPNANGEFIKVYLYLLCTMQSGRAVSVADLADALDCTERDIMRAFRYWEKQGLLALSFSGKTLVGVDVLPIDTVVSAPAASDSAESSAVSDSGESSAVSDSAENAPKKASRSSAASSVCDEPDAQEDPEKPAVTEANVARKEDVEKKNRSTATGETEDSEAASATKTDDSVPVPETVVASGLDERIPARKYTMDEFTADEQFELQMVEIASFKGAPLSPRDLEDLLFLYNLFPDMEMVAYVIEYCLENRTGRRWSVKTFHSVGIEWFNKYLDTVPQVKDYLKNVDYPRQLAKRLGQNPYKIPEVFKEAFLRWRDLYKFPVETAAYACDISAKQAGSSLDYADSILKDWYDKGIRSPEDAKKEHKRFTAQRKSDSAPSQQQPQAQTQAYKSPAFVHNFEERPLETTGSDLLKLALEAKKNRRARREAAENANKEK